MRAYITSIVGASLLASLMCGLIPGEEGKWVRLAAGLMVACALLKPAFSRWDIQVPSAERELVIQGGTYLADTFEQRLALEVERHLMQSLGAEVDVTVVAQTDENGTILGVEYVHIAPYTEELIKQTATFLEIDTDRVVEG